MSHALRKASRLDIPPRDKSKVASPRAVAGYNCSHKEQVKNAFSLGFERYETAMDKLSKV